jgi:hypothetical protein
MMPAPTKENLIAKKADLEQRKVQMLAEVNAIAGAIAILGEQIEEFDKPEQKEPPAAQMGEVKEA